MYNAEKTERIEADLVTRQNLIHNINALKKELAERSYGKISEKHGVSVYELLKIKEGLKIVGP